MRASQAMESLGTRVKCIPSNSRRKPQFRVATEFWETSEGAVVIKRAEKEAANFLDSISNREGAAHEFFAGLAEVVSGTRSDNTLIYEWLPHPSMQTIIKQQLEKNNKEGAFESLKRYVAFVRQLPCSRAHPNAFLNTFGIAGSHFPVAVRCLNQGPIDLIPDNVLVDGGKWHICDNEFFFDFEIPLDLVIYRGMATLVDRLQKQVRSAFSNVDVVPLFGFARKTIVIPTQWVAVFEPFEVSLRTLSMASQRFEQTILRHPAPSFVRSPAVRIAGQPDPLSSRLAAFGWYLARKLKSKAMQTVTA